MEQKGRFDYRSYERRIPFMKEILYALSTPDASQWGRVTKYYRSLDEIPYPKEEVPIIDDHVWQYSRDELLSILDEAGFRVERFEYAPGVVGRHFNVEATRKN